MKRIRDLPDVYDPMTLPTGEVLKPVGAESFKRTEIVSNREAQMLVATTQRKLAELPAIGNQMNALAAILCYTVSGLSDSEISVATSFTVDQIKRIRVSQPYKQIEGFFIDAVKNEATDEVKSIIADGTKKAAKKIVELVDGEDVKVALRASQDLLDRGGHKVADKLDVRHEMMNTFKIEVVDKRDIGGAAIVIDHEDV